MSELKDFPTDEDYNSNPRYREEFLKSQQEFRDKIMSYANEAGDNNEMGWLQRQILEIGRLEGKTMHFFCCEGNDIPEWQAHEVFYCVDMYREIIDAIVEIYERRMVGQ